MNNSPSSEREPSTEAIMQRLQGHTDENESKTTARNGHIVLGQDFISLLKKFNTLPEPGVTVQFFIVLYDYIGTFEEMFAFIEAHKEYLNADRIAELPPDTFKKFVQLQEALLKESLYLSNNPPAHSKDFKVPSLHFSPFSPLLNLFTHKLLVHGENIKRTDVQPPTAMTTQWLETSVFSRFTKRHQLAVHKFGQEAGPEYAATASAVLQHVSKGDDDERLNPINPETNGKWRVMLNRLYGDFKDFDIERVIGQFLIDGNIEVGSVIKFLFECYYKRDKETLTRQAVEELRSLIIIVESCFYDGPGDPIVEEKAQKIVSRKSRELLVRTSTMLRNDLGGTLADRFDTLIELPLGEDTRRKILHHVRNHRRLFQESKTDPSFEVRGVTSEGEYSTPFAHKLAFDNLIKHFTKTGVGISVKEFEDYTEELAVGMEIVGASNDLAGLFHTCISAAAEGDNALINEIKEYIVERARNTPEAICTSLAMMSYEEEDGEHHQLLDAIYEPDVIKVNTALVKTLCDEIKKIDYKTFYNTCTFIAQMIHRDESIAAFFAIGLKNILFKDGQNFTNPEYIYALRTILLLISEGARHTLIFTMVATPKLALEDAQTAARLLGDDLGKLFMVNYRNTHTDSDESNGTQADGSRKKRDRRAEAEEAAKQKMAGLELLKREGTRLEALLINPRNIPAEIAYIHEHCSIQIPEDIVKLGAREHGVNSPLTALFPNIFVKAGKGAEGLSCTAQLQTREGVFLYCRIEANGEFCIRLLDADGTEKSVIRRATAVAAGISERLFEELHYIIVKALQGIYVRKEKPKGNGSSTGTDTSSGSTTSSGTSTGGTGTTTNTSGGGTGGIVITPDIPVVHSRDDSSTLNVDLSDSDAVTAERAAAADRIVIGSNRDRVIQFFSQLNPGEALPEVMPKAFKDLILFERVPLTTATGKESKREFSMRRLDPEDAYEGLKIAYYTVETLHVQRRRAHTKPLPYTPSERRSFDTIEGTVIPRASIFNVIQNRPSEQALQRHKDFQRGGGTPMDLRKRRGFLAYKLPEHEDVNGTARAVQQKIVDPDFIEGQLATTRRELAEWKRDTLLTDTTADERELDAIIESKLAERREDLEGMAKRVKVEIVSVKDTGAPGGMRDERRLHLPEGGYEYKQTFVQGEFESVAELLAKGAEAEEE